LRKNKGRQRYDLILSNQEKFANKNPAGSTTYEVFSENYLSTTLNKNIEGDLENFCKGLFKL